jgi:hypothetical protein
LLLQKSDGDFYILLWHEISAEDVSVNPHKQLEHPEMPVELVFQEPVSNAVVYRYKDDMTFESAGIDIVDDKISLTVPDQIVVVRVTPGASSVQSRGRTKSFCLLRNYPNPFNSSTSIFYELPLSSHVRLEIYDARGRLISTLVDDFQTAGHYKVPFSNSRLPSGTYHCKLTAGDLITHRKMLLLR